MKYISIIFFLVMASYLHAQGLADLLRYSENHYLGTARTVGVGSAYGAMGGDYSSVTINPAGLGDFKKSDFTLGLGYKTNLTKNSLANGVVDQRQFSRLTIDHIGYISSTLRSSNLRNSNLSFGFSRNTDFGKNISAQGISKGSITDLFLAQAGNTPKTQLNSFDTKVAYDAGAIYLNDNNKYVSDYKPKDEISKSHVTNRTGSMSEFTVGWGGNFNNKLNVGVSIGIPLGSYSRTSRYKQNFTEEQFTNNLEYEQKLSANISGINIKAGAVYRPAKFIRLGAAVHSPSVLTVTEDFSNNMKYSYNAKNSNYKNSASSPEGYFKYNITTPWKGILSAGGLFKQNNLYGFVNADIEYVGYQSATFNLTNYSDNVEDASYQKELNNEVKDRLTSHTNLRLGAELGYKNYRVRGGFGLMQTPFESDQPRQQISFGAGINFDSFFLDLAYRTFQNNETLYPYFQSGSSTNPRINSNGREQRVVVSAGFRF